MLLKAPQYQNIHPRHFRSSILTAWEGEIQCRGSVNLGAAVEATLEYLTGSLIQAR